MSDDPDLAERVEDAVAAEAGLAAGKSSRSSPCGSATAASSA
jgi:hypothetical protein